MADAVAAQGQRAKDFPFDKVHKCRIHPGVGIARVGNSPDQHFVGPEAPWDPQGVTAPDGSFKDEEGRIKRQGARFRIYAYDKNNRNLGELPLGNSDAYKAKSAAKVEWTVHLANKKGAWYKFFTRFEDPDPDEVRNADVPVAKGQPPDSRESLVIDPGPRSINGDGKPVARRGVPQTLRFDTGTFRGMTVPLGEIRLDNGSSRLVVLGGLGLSASTRANNPIGSDSAADDYWANNDYWYDDISDGPVTASVTLPNGKAIAIDQPKDSAWVIVAPPKYAPGIYPVVSLYDVMREVALDEKWIEDDGKVEYFRDIHPMLKRAVGISWVNQQALRGHGFDKRGEFRPRAEPGRANADKKAGKKAKLEPKTRVNAALLASHDLETPAGSKEDRERIFRRLRNPIEPSAGQANTFYMPPMSGDGGPRTLRKPETWLSILPSQYRNFKKWAEGKFTRGEEPKYPPFKDIDDPVQQTDALQRGALEPCIGGAFYPGIEAGWTVLDADLYADAFRINSRKHRPGDITKSMCLPWQADYYDCRDTWWPSARPDDVIPEDVFEEANKLWRPGQPKVIEALEGRVKWDRGLGVTTLFRRPWQNPADAADDPRDTERRGGDDMVRYWHELGFVMARKTAWSNPDSDSEYVFVETERRPHAGMDVRQLFHCLLNMDDSKKRSCLPKVQEFVDNVLAAARELQDTASAFAWMDNIRPFDYDEDVFDARMKDIYDDCADFAFTEKLDDNGDRVPYDPGDPVQNPVFRTREAVTERIKQLTPFNFLDGAWLRNIHRVGPVDEVNSILFTIMKEELGDGVPSQNHANIYRDLCHSFGFYPPPMESTAFAYDQVFLDCAFDSPAFQLGISEFSRRYYPEIIGMSLWLEWTVMELHRIASIAEMVGLSSHFYRMHIAIDNAASGHGAGIIRAVKLYLRQVRIEGGEKAVQAHWKRIWDGYVAFSYTFVIVIRQVARILNDPPSLQDKLERLIAAKALYGQYNHGNKKLGRSSINSFFIDPPTFLQALQEHNYIIPGQPNESKFFKLLEFRGGPMYHVFTEDEIKLWRDWTWELGAKKGPNLQRLKDRLTRINASFMKNLSDDKLKTWQVGAADHRIALWLEIAAAESARNTPSDQEPGTVTPTQQRDIVKSIDARYETWLGWGMIRAATFVAAEYRDNVEGVEVSFPDPHNEKKLLTVPQWFDRIRIAANSAVPAHALLTSFGKAVLERRVRVDELFGAGTALAYAFNHGVPGNDGRRARDTMAAWIDAGCRLPEEPKGRVKPLRLDASLNEEECHPTGLSMGFGTVH